MKMTLDNDNRPLQDRLRDKRFKLGLGMVTRNKVADHIDALDAEIGALKHDNARLVEIASDEVTAIDTPAGYAVTMPDDSSPTGFWFVGAWCALEVAIDMAQRQGRGSRMRPIVFADTGESA